jgi:hypothetical protein
MHIPPYLSYTTYFLSSCFLLIEAIYGNIMQIGYSITYPLYLVFITCYRFREVLRQVLRV